MIFFVNQAMGIGNSGVEHAQFYRAKLFDSISVPYTFIFTELVKELHEAMEKWAIPQDKVINLWEFLVFEENYSNMHVSKEFISETFEIDFTETHRTKKTVTSSNMLIIEHFEKSPSKDDPNMLIVSVSRVEIYDRGTMEKKIMFSYVNDANRGKIMSNIHLFNYKGKHLIFTNEVKLQRFFFEEISGSFYGKNIFILDRGQETEAALLNNKIPNTKIVDVVHADHLSDKEVVSAPLWNNHYEYLLTHIDRVDAIVVATELQKEDLLIDFPKEEKIVAIPVGGIRDFSVENEKPILKKEIKKFITVSRLAKEKHIDLVVKAIAKAKKIYPQISLDIYGQGEEFKLLSDLIQELDAESYISLKGHSNDLDNIYPEYDVFISGSFSEGFGLTYIEALNAGLPVVTFKARFGAMELIKNGENGVLKEFSRTDDTFSEMQLTEGVIEILELDFEELQKNTRFSVESFQDSTIADKWRGLLNAL